MSKVKAKPLGIVSTEDVVCFQCAIESFTFGEVATNVGYPVGFTCADCGEVVMP